MPTLGVLLILHTNYLYASHFNQGTRWYVAGIIFFCSFIVPSLCMGLLKLAGSIGSFQMHSKEERRLPLLITSISLMVTFYIFSTTAALNLPYLINGFLLGTATALVTAAICNYFFKISLHSIGWGGLIALICLLLPTSGRDLRPLLAVAIVMAGLTGSARLFLESHRPFQVYVGYLTGFLSVYLLLNI